MEDKLTRIYCVRHALPVPDHTVDRERALSEEGRTDTRKVTEALREIRLDAAVSSPYLRSIDTIRECALEHGLTIRTDEDFRERKVGDTAGRQEELTRMRWADFDFAEPGGECLRSVEERNLRAFGKLLTEFRGKNVLFGTHGTALSVILHHYDPSWDYGGFRRIEAWMPYVVRLDFAGEKYVGREELLTIDKGH